MPRSIEIADELLQKPAGRVQKFKLRHHGVRPETWDAEGGRVRGGEVA